MSPVPPANQMSDGASCNAKLGGKVHAALSCGTAADDLKGLLVRELYVPLAATERHQTEPHGMGSVPLRGHEFKVFDAVVRLHTVDVVDLQLGRDGSDEGGEYQPVDETSGTSAINPKLAAQVPATDNGRSKDARLLRMPFAIAAHDNTGAGSNSPVVGDLVRVGPFGKGKPAFGGIFGVSHVSLLSGSVVRLGVDVGASPRAAFIFAQNEVQA